MQERTADKMKKYMMSFGNGQSQIILAPNADAAMVIAVSMAEEQGTELMSVIAMC